MFYLGGSRDFDILAASVLREMKRSRYPNIRLSLIVPFEGIREEGYDEIIYPDLKGVPPCSAVSKRDEWMVCQSDVPVACVGRKSGEDFDAIECARRAKLKIISYK